MFKLIPATPVINSYIDRINARPAVQKVPAKYAELAAAPAN
jgi:glutathione S-transferase